MARKKNLFRFNFFLILFLGFLLFTITTFLIVTINENKKKTPKTISCMDLSLVEEEIIKLFPSDIFITKDLYESSKNKSTKLIILENQTEQSILKRFENNLDISLLGYGIYKNDTNETENSLNFNKGKYNFTISFDDPSEFIQNEKVFKLPKNPVTLILKCVKK